MNRKEFQNVFPQTPGHFIDRMDGVLDKIENSNMEKRPFRFKAALIAAALVVLLAGSAVAIGSYMGVFDFMNRVAEPIVPLKGAEELLENSLGYAQSGFGSVEITEGIYSGRSCKLTVKVNMAEGYTHFYPELRFLNAQNPGAGALDMVENEDGTVQYMIESMLEKDVPEMLECEVVLPVFKDGAAQKDIKLYFSLKHAAGESARLVPQSEGERWKILSGTVTRNKFNMVFDIEFEYTAETGEEMGVDIRAFDMNGVQLPGGDSSYGDGELPVIGESMICRQIQEIQSSEAMPEHIVLKPKVIGEDKWLDGIVCRIE